MLLETVRNVLSGASAENAVPPADRIHDSFSTILETAAA
jgi:hypothetical protein